MTSRTTPLPSGEPTVARPWWQLGLAAAIGGAVINVILFYIYQAVTGGPIRVVQPGVSGILDLPVWMVALQSALPPLVAGLLAAGLNRWTKSAAVWFTVISVVLVALSLLSPLTMPAEIPMTAKLTLAVMHLVVAGATLVAYVPRLAAARA